MNSIRHHSDVLARFVAGSLFTGASLLLCRLALAGVFWRAGRSKVVEGSWLTISDTTRFLFEQEYRGVPLPAPLSMYLATYAEHLLPILLVLGLATRCTAFALLAMTLTIQLFVYPDAWWPVHSLWAAMALMLIARGGGVFSLDALLLNSKTTGATARS